MSILVLVGNRELVALRNLSSWCLVMVERLFFTVPRGCLWFVIVVFLEHTHLLFLKPLIFMYLLKTDHAPGEPLVGPFFPRALFGANLNMVHWMISGI